LGVSANVVVANLATHAGHPIRFGQFLRYGAVIVAESMVISSACVWLRYVA
jgi:Na+/H+ antiporter NhaD/arsenite permease-like protein